MQIAISGRDRIIHAIALIALVLPWFVPPVFGPTPAIPGLLLAWGCLAIFGIAYVTGFTPTSARFYGRSVQFAWALAASLSSGIALSQYFGLADQAYPWVSTAAPGEAFANLRQRNHLATLTNIGLASIVWFSGSMLSKTTLCGAVALLATANAASGSRTGLAQLIFLFVLSSIPSGPKPGRQRLMALACFFYAVATLLLPWAAGLPMDSGGVLGRLHENTPACASRRVIWSNVMHLIAQKPWLGWGWGELDYAHFITLYPGDRFCNILDNAHNLPLQFAVEMGLPATLTLCAFSLWLIFRAWSRQATDPTRELAWVVLALVGLHSMLEYPLWYGPFQMTAAICVFLISRSADVGRLENQSGMRRQWVERISIISACTCVIGIVGYAGWQYWRVNQIYLSADQRAAGYRTNTLSKIQGNVLFTEQIRFAELVTTPLSPANASSMHGLAEDLLHFSPEPRVVEILIESSILLGLEADATYYLHRFKAAFPAEYLAWRSTHPSAGAP
jgi:O-antigen ligase